MCFKLVQIDIELLLNRYNGFMRESMFSVGLQRVATADVAKVKDIIDATFDRVIA